MDERMNRQSERLGNSIRSVRRARGLTLVGLAELSGLSHPFLSQVERGVARPSMVSLEKIARALGTSQLELMAGSAETAGDDLVGQPVFVARAEGERGPYGLGEARMLVTGEREFLPMEFVGSNQSPGDFHTHLEDEFLYCVGGEAVIDLGPAGLFEVAAGDSLYFAGGTPHRWYSPVGAEYRLFLVKQKRRIDSVGVSVWTEPGALVAVERAEAS